MNNEIRGSKLNFFKSFFTYRYQRVEMNKVCSNELSTNYYVL